MDFYIQDPTYSESYSLHEALLQACEGAYSGGGAYAFVSTGGVKLFLEDDVFEKLASNGVFKLVVGIDEITSERALKKLNDLKNRYDENLEVYAFMHDTKGSLFHPKFSWFKNARGGILVLGSGNLTEKGLRRNREAFSFIEVNQSEIEEIEKYWNDWLDHNNSYLKPIDDGEVLKKARLNTKIYSRIKAKVELDIEIEDQEEQEHQITQIKEDEDIEAWNFGNRDPVLIAEIPNNNVRWKQANFDKNSFVNFFGAIPGNNDLRILFRNVLGDGKLADIEVRQSVSVSSHNWRFELGAASGKAYPTNGRPIGIFIRVSTRMFLYIIAMPTDSFYKEIRQFLDMKISTTKNRMKRYHTTVAELKGECSHLPIWKVII